MKQFIKSGILLLLMTALLVGCSEAEEEANYIEVYTFVEAEAEPQYTLENENLLFELDPSTTYFKVTDKSNGTEWHSNPVDIDTDAIAFGDKLNELKSTMIIAYSSSLGVERLYNNYEYSISRGIYEIEQKDDSVFVKYTIGNVQKEFIIPPALPESRMNEYLDLMDKNGQKQIREYYRKYDINNLRSSDNKSELLATYPDLENECVYVLRTGLQDYLKGIIEDVFAEVGYTLDDFEEDMSRYDLGAAGERLLFNITVKYSLDGNDLVVELPVEEMEWIDAYPLSKIKVLPFFGAGGLEDEGFVLIPEGPGGIIEFNNSKTSQNAYYADVYGWDLGLKRNSLINETHADYPVFGISKNDSSMICILEEYASVATIGADISGKDNSYNYANATYRILHGDSAEISAKSDRTVMVFEENDFEGAVTQRYRFIHSDGYVGMADAYRDYLVDRYGNLAVKEHQSVPVNINIIGAIDKTKQRFGVPVSVAIPLTTYKEAKELIEDLNNRGFANMSAVYLGWMNKGIKHSDLNKIKTIKNLGSKKDLKNFIEYANQTGVNVYLEGNTQFAYNNGFFDGYIVNKHSAKHSTREIAELYEFANVTFKQAKWKDEFYFVKPQMMEKYVNNLADAAGKYQATGIALRDVGLKLGADYNPKNHITRENVMLGQKDMLEGVYEQGKGVVTYGGNDYVLAYSDYILDMELKGDQYTVIDYMVPFYQMVIHGVVDYYSMPINLSEDYSETLLKCAEYGAGLSFTFMTESTMTVQESNYTYFYGADYDEWKELADEIYKKYNSELGHCFNQRIVGYEKIDNGISATLYEDGTKVYVNYNYVDYEYAGIVVPARDYKSVKGDNDGR